MDMLFNLSDLVSHLKYDNYSIHIIVLSQNLLI